MSEIGSVHDAARVLAGILVLMLGALVSTASAYDGGVVDTATTKPIGGAVVTLGTTVVTSDAAGAFRIEGRGAVLQARAVGYGRATVPVPGSSTEPIQLVLAPLRPKALYLSFYGVGSRQLREQALKLIDETELNALAIAIGLGK